MPETTTIRTIQNKGITVSKKLNNFLMIAERTAVTKSNIQQTLEELNNSNQ